MLAEATFEHHQTPWFCQLLVIFHFGPFIFGPFGDSFSRLLEGKFLKHPRPSQDALDIQRPKAPPKGPLFYEDFNMVVSQKYRIPKKKCKRKHMFLKTAVPRAFLFLSHKQAMKTTPKCTVKNHQTFLTSLHP